jgi:hypothetical protein
LLGDVSWVFGRWWSEGTGDGVVSYVVGTDVAVAVAVESCHGLSAEEAKGFLEDWGVF